MTEALGGILGGLGLFFVGTLLLSENLNALTSRRLRLTAASLVSNRFTGYGWGVLAGGLTQSSTALTFIMVGMLRAGFVSTHRAFAVITGGNVGTVLIVLVVSMDVRLAAFYAMGLVGILIVSNWGTRYRAHGMALFGVGLMLVGLAMMQEYASPISSQPWFEDVLIASSHSLWLSFTIAVVLAVLLQSVAVVVILGITLSSAGILPLDHTIMFIYGAHFGASCILLALSWHLTGTSRRIAMFQVTFNFTLCLILVPLLYLENWSGVPLAKSVIERIGLDLEKQLGIYVILIQLVPGILLFIALDWIDRLFARRWPASEMETISQTEFVKDMDYQDVGMALQLAVREQQRVLDRFSSYLDAVRQGKSPGELSESTRRAIREVSDFLAELRRRYAGHSPEATNSVLAQQRIIVWLEEQFRELSAELAELPDDEETGRLRYALLEGIDTVVMTVSENLASEGQKWPTALDLTNNVTEALTKIRNDHIYGGVPLSGSVRETALKAINTAEAIFFLLRWLAQEKEAFTPHSSHSEDRPDQPAETGFSRMNHIWHSFQRYRSNPGGTSMDD